MSTVRTPLAVAFVAIAMFSVAFGAAAKPNPHAVLDCGFCHATTPRFGVDTVDTVDFWRAEGDEPQLCERCHGPETNFHPLGVTPGPAAPGHASAQAAPPGQERGRARPGGLHQLPLRPRRERRPGVAARVPRVRQPGPVLRAGRICAANATARDLEKRSPHAGDERSCAFCHSTKPQPGQSATVTPAGRKLCEFCHGFKSEEHYAGVNPFKEPQDCTGCHDPHLGKDRPARLRAGYFDTIRDAVTFNPHRKRTLCFACHADGKPGPLRGAAAVALCQRCHDSGKIPGMSHPMTKVPAGFAIPQGWPLSDGAMTCLTCHFAGHAPGVVAGRPDEPVSAQYLLRGADAGQSDRGLLQVPREEPVGRSQSPPARSRGRRPCAPCATPRIRRRGTPRRFVAGINILCLSVPRRRRPPRRDSPHRDGEGRDAKFPGRCRSERGARSPARPVTIPTSIPRPATGCAGPRSRRLSACVATSSDLLLAFFLSIPIFSPGAQQAGRTGQGCFQRTYSNRSGVQTRFTTSFPTTSP